MMVLCSCSQIFEQRDSSEDAGYLDISMLLPRKTRRVTVFFPIRDEIQIVFKDHASFSTASVTQPSVLACSSLHCVISATTQYSHFFFVKCGNSASQGCAPRGQLTALLPSVAVDI